MKKIYLLKTIVDIVWIFSMISVLLAVGLLIAVWFIDISDFAISFNSVLLVENSLLSKFLFAIGCVCYLLLIAALHYFRKALQEFLRVRIFEQTVINYFSKIGNLLLISGVTSLVLFFLANLFLHSVIHLDIGLNQFVIIICLGLFFTVLSEVFKIAKNQKEENDLTI